MSVCDAGVEGGCLQGVNVKEVDALRGFIIMDEEGQEGD